MVEMTEDIISKNEVKEVLLELLEREVSKLADEHPLLDSRPSVEYVVGYVDALRDIGLNLLNEILESPTYWNVLKTILTEKSK